MMPYSRFFNYNSFPFGFGGLPGVLFLLVMIWSLFWKGWALWEAARNKSKGWFVALLVINTMGILEIAYLFFFAANLSANRKRVKKPFSK